MRLKKMYLYHYCVVIPLDSGARYDSGSVMLSDKIEDNDDYSKMVANIAESIHVDRKDMAVLTLNLVNG